MSKQHLPSENCHAATTKQQKAPLLDSHSQTPKLLVKPQQEATTKHKTKHNETNKNKTSSVASTNETCLPCNAGHHHCAHQTRAGHITSRGGKSGLSNEPIFPQPPCLSQQKNTAKCLALWSSRKWSMLAPWLGLGHLSANSTGNRGKHRISTHRFHSTSCRDTCRVDEKSTHHLVTETPNRSWCCCILSPSAHLFASTEQW